jgi:hypothetical protein
VAAPRDRDGSRRVNNATGQHDDEHTEGQVLAIDASAQPPVVVIAGGDGPIALRLRGDALTVLGRLRVGHYVSADGEKQHEGLYDVDELDIED